MSATPEFKNHVFISYSHIDNGRLPAVSEGWIDLFHEGLNWRLPQLLGEPVNIWRDRKLRGNEVFNATIVLELSQTAVLVSVISPRYLLSSACQQELEEFCRVANASGGIRISDMHRVFKVVKTYVPFQEHPAALRNMLGYEFYALDQSSGRFREYDHEISPKREKDKRYWDKFEDLAQDICFLLKRMLGGPTQPTAQSPGETVYLAETTSDVSEERDSIRRELQQHGHMVLPDKPLPLKGQALQEAIREYLNRSRLSIHLIGEFYDTVIRIQQELAVERVDNEDFSRLIWMPPGLAPADKVQQQFITELQNSFTSKNGSELLQTKLEDLKTIIESKLTPKEQVSEVQGDEVTRIYLICDKLDSQAVKPLYNYLLFDRGFQVKLSLTEGNGFEIRQDHKKNLLECDAVIIFFGSASEDWLRTQFAELPKARGYGRLKPFLSKAIYVTAPRTDQKELLESIDPLIIRNFEDFTPDSLAPFLKQIDEVKGKGDKHSK